MFGKEYLMRTLLSTDCLLLFLFYHFRHHEVAPVPEVVSDMKVSETVKCNEALMYC